MRFILFLHFCGIGLASVGGSLEVDDSLGDELRESPPDDSVDEPVTNALLFKLYD